MLKVPKPTGSGSDKCGCCEGGLASQESTEVSSKQAGGVKGPGKAPFEEE